MTERDPALEPFDALTGTWVTEATHPLFDAVVPGMTTYEWFEGGHFIVQRFSAALGHDTFEGRWQLARTPGDWRDDLKVTYFRRD